MANALRHVLAGPGPFARARSFGIDAAEARHARYARLARWRRAAPASAPALASLDGARGGVAPFADPPSFPSPAVHRDSADFRASSQSRLLFKGNSSVERVKLFDPFD